MFRRRANGGQSNVQVEYLRPQLVVVVLRYLDRLAIAEEASESLVGALKVVHQVIQKQHARLAEVAQPQAHVVVELADQLPYARLTVISKPRTIVLLLLVALLELQLAQREARRLRVKVHQAEGVHSALVHLLELLEDFEIFPREVRDLTRAQLGVGVVVLQQLAHAVEEDALVELVGDELLGGGVEVHALVLVLDDQAELLDLQGALRLVRGLLALGAGERLVGGAAAGAALLSLVDANHIQMGDGAVEGVGGEGGSRLVEVGGVAAREEGLLLELEEAEALLLVDLEGAAEELLGLLGDGDVAVEAELRGALLELAFLVDDPGTLPVEHLVVDDADAPDVAFFGVAVFEEALGTHVDGRADAVDDLVLGLGHFGEAVVGDFGYFFLNEYVSRLDIAVNNSFVDLILESVDNVLEYLLGFHLGNAAVLLDEGA